MPHLISRKGNIVNISSIAAKRPMPGAAAYCVSKAGVDMLTQQTALEMASKVPHQCMCLWKKLCKVVACADCQPSFKGGYVLVLT